LSDGDQKLAVGRLRASLTELIGHTRCSWLLSSVSMNWTTKERLQTGVNGNLAAVKRLPKHAQPRAGTRDATDLELGLFDGIRCVFLDHLSQALDAANRFQFPQWAETMRRADPIASAVSFQATRETRRGWCWSDESERCAWAWGHAISRSYSYTATAMLTAEEACQSSKPDSKTLQNKSALP
jgi:hypothetical protein